MADQHRLKYAIDAGFLSGTHPPDTPPSAEVESEGNPDSGSSNSASDSNGLSDITTSLRLFSESMSRTDLAELEMTKAMETRRIEAEKRRVEAEAEMTQMLLQTQLQIASFLSSKKKVSSRKRKRAKDKEREDSSSPKRDAALMLSLMQFTMLC